MGRKYFTASMKYRLLSMDEMVIIPYDKAYLQDLARLVTNIQQNEFGIPITLEEQPDLLDIPGFFLSGKGNF